MEFCYLEHFFTVAPHLPCVLAPGSVLGCSTGVLGGHVAAADRSRACGGYMLASGDGETYDIIM